MILDAAMLVRAASGVVFLGVGLILGWAAPRARERLAANMGLALGCGAFGASFVATNLLSPPSTMWMGFAIQAACFAVACVALLFFVVSGHLRRHFRWSDLAIAAGALVGAFAFFQPDFGAALFRANAFPDTAYRGITVVLWRLVALTGVPTLGAFTLIAVTSARAYAEARDARERVGYVLLAAGVIAYPAFMTGLTLSLAATDPSFLGAASAMAVLVATAGFAWSRADTRLTLLILGTTLLGQLGPISGIYTVGVGVLRILAAALIALAMLRYGLAGADLHRPTARRGTLAAGALAVLFIVAQIAQEFFAAEYGLLMGGVVAGALLFAANPVQRAMERLVDPRSHRPPLGGVALAPSNGSPRREAVFRDALRLALHDKRLTRAEESPLHLLAVELGIGGGRAHAILVEIEAEVGAR